MSRRVIVGGAGLDLARLLLANPPAPAAPEPTPAKVFTHAVVYGAHYGERPCQCAVQSQHVSRQAARSEKRRMARYWRTDGRDPSLLHIRALPVAR